MITCHLLQKTLSFLFKSKDETDWSQQQRSKRVHTRIKREREKGRERERVHNGASPRPGRWKGRGKKRRKKREKENQFPRSGQLGGIHRDTTFPWPRKSGISKERRICVQKTDGFHPVATLLSIQPPPPPPRFFFSTLNRFFYATSPLFSLFFFFSLPFFEFNRRLTPWNFRRNPSEYAGYASSASPPLISSLRCEMISRNQEKIYLPLPPSFCVSLSLSLFVSCGLKTESFKGERAASDFTPNQRFFTQFLRVFTRSQGGALDNGVTGIVWTISSQTLKDSAF